MEACLDEETVLAFVEGRLPPDVILRLERHVAQCAACAELLEVALSADSSSAGSSEPAEILAAKPTSAAADASLLFGETLHDVNQRAESDVGLKSGLVLGDRYELLEHLGSGGMGAVYAAHDRLLDQDVALKFLRRSLANDPTALNRLRHEVRLAQSVTHVNVARTFTLDESDGHMFIVMELLRGVTLASSLRQGALDIDEALRIGQDVLAGLASAHARGVIHRDIKPSNIKICNDGRVVLFDFGLARAGDLPSGTRNSLRLDLLSTPYQTHSVLCGTPGYIAPELVDGASADVASDLYSFGVVLFEMLAGRPPFQANTPTDLVRMHVSTPVPDIATIRPDLSSVVAVALHRLLQKNPAKRFRTAEETHVALGAVTAQKPRPTSRVALGVAAAIVAAAAASTIAWGLRVRHHGSSDVARTSAQPLAVVATPAPKIATPLTVASSPQPAPNQPDASIRRSGSHRKHATPSLPVKAAAAHESENEAARKRQRLLELEQ